MYPNGSVPRRKEESEWKEHFLKCFPLYQEVPNRLLFGTRRPIRPSYLELGHGIISSPITGKENWIPVTGSDHLSSEAGRETHLS